MYPGSGLAGVLAERERGLDHAASYSIGSTRSPHALNWTVIVGARRVVLVLESYDDLFRGKTCKGAFGGTDA